MKLYKYNQFINDKPINENLDKAKKFMKERYLLTTAASELGFVTGELDAQLKHGEKRSLTLKDFNEEQQIEIKQKLRELKLNDEIVRNIERDPAFIKIRELLKDNLGYMYPFVYFYFVEMVSIDELFTNENSLYNKLFEYKDLLDKMPKKFDANFIDVNIPNNMEILVDGIDKLEDYKIIKRVVDKLTPVLKKDYNASPVAIKEQFAEIARAFDNVGGGDVDRKAKIWKSFFGEMKEVGGVKKFFGPLKRYTDIRAFIKSAQNYIKSSQNDDIIAFYDKINLCNDKFGQLGADIVFDENNILVIEVKSFPANQLLNGHTRHCIKDSMSQWESYVSSRNNKQYYIYNYNLPQYENFFTIGVTIAPYNRGSEEKYSNSDRTGEIYNSSYSRACHAKDDTNISTTFKGLLKKWEKEYNISSDIFDECLLPMTKEEIDRRERSKLADREIIKKGISIEKIKQYVTVDGANINKDNCVALLNSVEEDDIEKTKYILELGGSPNLRAKSESVINKAKNIEMVKLLVSHGSELTGQVYENISNSPDAVLYCLKQGLNPDFDNYLPIRKSIKGTYVSRDNIGEGYFDVFKLLIDNGAKINDAKSIAVKWAADYARMDFIDYMIEHCGVRSGFKASHQWASHSLKLSEKYRKELSDYLLEKTIQYEDPNYKGTK